MDLFYWLVLNLLASTLSRLADLYTLPTMVMLGIFVGLWSEVGYSRWRWAAIPLMAGLHALLFVDGSPPVHRWAFFIAGDCIIGLTVALATIGVARTYARRPHPH
jgi:hypothetical protein